MMVKIWGKRVGRQGLEIFGSKILELVKFKNSGVLKFLIVLLFLTFHNHSSTVPDEVLTVCIIILLYFVTETTLVCKLFLS